MSVTLSALVAIFYSSHLPIVCLYDWKLFLQTLIPHIWKIYILPCLPCIWFLLVYLPTAYTGIKLSIYMNSYNYNYHFVPISKVIFRTFVKRCDNYYKKLYTVPTYEILKTINWLLLGGYKIAYHVVIIKICHLSFVIRSSNQLDHHPCLPDCDPIMFGACIFRI